MQQTQTVIEVVTSGQGLYEFSRPLRQFVTGSGICSGLATVFCRHTSCSLLIQENADPDVQVDLKGFFSRLVHEHMPWITHTLEGPDDMPAHIKAALTQTSIGIPVDAGSLVLGTWQGVYLFEHRSAPHRRQVVVHIIGE